MTETQPAPIPWGPLARVGAVSLAVMSDSRPVE